MELLQTEIQRELEDVVTRLVQDKSDFGQYQARLANGEWFDRELWSSLADLGLLCVPFGEEEGGTGGGFADVVAVLEALGKGLCNAPYTSNVVLCGSLLPSDSSFLKGVLDGDRLLAFGHLERGSRDDLARVEARAERVDEGYLLAGEKVHVFGGDVADSFIVSARTSGEGTDTCGISLFMVDKNAPGLSVKGYISNDNTGAAGIVLDGVPGQLIGAEGEGIETVQRAWDRATAAACAEAVGAMAALLEATVDYIKTREQFNTTLGSFQVVQHMAADMLVNLEHARSLLVAAGRYADSDDAAERGGVISAAKLGINDAARFVANTAVQLHGGIGMTEECAVGHHFRRLTAIRLAYGDSNFHLQRLEALEAQQQTHSTG